MVIVVVLLDGIAGPSSWTRCGKNTSAAMPLIGIARNRPGALAR